jgi:hypothetical protein
MQNEILEAFDTSLQVFEFDGLVWAVSHKDATRSVQVASMVPLEIGDVSTVVDRDGFEAFMNISATS